MSFKALPKKELLRTAREDFAVDVSDTDSKPDIAAQLAAAGVTWEQYEALHPEVEEEVVQAPADNVIRVPEVTDENLPRVHYSTRGHKDAQRAEEADDLVLVKMIRANPYYEIRGYTFSKAHPFQLVKEDDVDFLTLTMDGFRMATPREVKEYYS